MKANGNSCPHVNNAFNAYGAAVQFHQLINNRKP